MLFPVGTWAEQLGVVLWAVGRRPRLEAGGVMWGHGCREAA